MFDLSPDREEDRLKLDYSISESQLELNFNKTVNLIRGCFSTNQHHNRNLSDESGIFPRKSETIRLLADNIIKNSSKPGLENNDYMN